MFNVIFFCFVFLGYGYMVVSSLEDSVEELSLRIVGGEEAPESVAPYQASLRDLTNFSFCGGAVLNKRWVVTAAHCTEGRSNESITIVVGTTDRIVGGDRYAVESFIMHDYNATLANDLSLIKVREEIQFNDHVQPIQLPDKDIGAGEEVTLTGWGRLSYLDRALPAKLHVVNLTTMGIECCKTLYQPIIPLYSTQICTLNKPGKGSCVGDSGGPLVANGSLVGVVSYGRPCALGFPDVFTRVYSYKDWIRAKISD